MPYPVPYATTGWDEILPNLFMGGHHFDPLRKFSSYPQNVVVADEFDLVVSLYRGGRHYGPPPNIAHLVHEVPDGPLDDEQRQVLRDLADTVVLGVRGAQRTLVRCEAGYNRSGLVVGLVLLRLGYGVDEAVGLIRTRRSRHALCNETFVDYLREEARVGG
jgi:protein-tyrosine phosphatase